MRSVLLMVALAVGGEAPAGEWRRLTPLPDREGFAGPFAGVSAGALLVAGGANFPDRKPWEGGTKVWYDRVFVLERPDGAWSLGGRLPRPLGYGVSVTDRSGVVCVGGSDSGGYRTESFRLEWSGGRLVTTSLPPLPKPLANAAGALVGETLYLAGGQEGSDRGATSRAAWRIDLAAKAPAWEEIDACPGRGRMLAVAAGCDGAFWLAGGVDLVVGAGGSLERRYLKDAYRYDPREGWRRIADLPEPVAAAPSPAPADDRGFWILGGDDGAQVGVAPDAHRGFGRNILRYDTQTGAWSNAGKVPAPRETVPSVRWNTAWVVPGGEMRPGLRSPDVWALTPGLKE